MPPELRSSRYSELSSITPQNAANLKVAWAFHRRAARTEGQPCGREYMYVVTPYPNVLIRHRPGADGPAAQMEIPA